MNTDKKINKIAEIRKKYTVLYSQIEAILFKYDLMDINYGDNCDEYSPEVSTILPRLNNTTNINDVANVIKEEFNHWFKEDISKGKKIHTILLKMSEEIHVEWLKFTKL